MVSISHEKRQQTDARLRGVLAQAELERLPGAWCFSEEQGDREATLDPLALAAIRDGEVLSQLVPAAATSGERFCVLSFHFPPGQDNSGFVGWLAGELKHALGAGVFVICGSNRARGGIYDYWGVPEALGDEALATIARLARVN